MAHLISTSEIMHPKECARLESMTNTGQLWIAAWESDISYIGEKARHGVARYVTYKGDNEVHIWRDALGNLCWKETKSVWIPRDKIDDFHQRLILHGFTGTRSNDPQHGTVVFKQKRRTLDVHFSHDYEPSDWALDQTAKDAARKLLTGKEPAGLNHSHHW